MRVTSQGQSFATGSVYGAMMHFGGIRTEFSHLWGAIPDRF